MPISLIASTASARTYVGLTPALNSSRMRAADYDDWITETSSDDGSQRLTDHNQRYLCGLAAGKSISRTLQDLGLSKQEAKDARERVDQEIKDAKRD